MPLKPGSSQETISDNISEMLESPTFGRGKRKKKRLEMAQAAAYRKAGKSRSNPHPKKKVTVTQAALGRRKHRSCG